MISSREKTHSGSEDSSHTSLNSVGVSATGRPSTVALWRTRSRAIPPMVRRRRSSLVSIARRLISERIRLTSSEDENGLVT